MFVSKMSAVTAEVSTLKAANHVDYSNTRFHNAMIVKHPQATISHSESAFQEEMEKLKKGAFEMAKEEQTKKSI